MAVELWGAALLLHSQDLLLNWKSQSGSCIDTQVLALNGLNFSLQS